MPGTTKTKRWYSRFNNYKLSIILTFLATTCVVVAGVFLHDLPTWEMPFHNALHAGAQALTDLFRAVYGYFFVSRMVSGMGYIVTPVDIATQDTTLIEALVSEKNIIEETTNKQAAIKSHSLRQRFILWLQQLKQNIKQRPLEFVGLLIGGLSGLLCVVVPHFLGIQIDPLVLKNGLGMFFTYIASISTFSGLFSRLGRSCDFYKKKWAEKIKSKWINEETVNYVLSVTAGIILGSVLMGVVLGLHLLPGGHFVVALGAIGIMSTSASSSGYIGRLFDAGGLLHVFSGFKIADYFRAEKHESLSNTSKVAAAKKCESRGTAIGVSMGLTLGIILIVAGVATLPFFGLGLPKLLAGIMITATCISVSGGLGNRIGNSMDKKRHLKEQAIAEQSIPKPEVTSVPALVSTPAVVVEPVAIAAPTPAPVPKPALSRSQSLMSLGANQNALFGKSNKVISETYNTGVNNRSRSFSFS